MIEINKISKSFKKCQALKDISFNVNDGEIIGLLGENGAGKSTLLRTISTMLIPDSGSAKINGYDLLKEPADVRKSVGILFGSEVGLYERLTARENLEYFANLNGMTKNEIDKRISDLSEEFEFKDYINKRVGTFSRGMKQKVAIARSIIHDPYIILLDEPDAGLDFKASKIILDFIESSKNNKKSIIFSSHSIENIKNYSDRMVIIHKGQIVKIIDMTEFREKYTDKEINNILFNLVCEGDENV